MSTSGWQRQEESPELADGFGECIRAIGVDRFNYTIEDEPFARAQGVVEVEIIAAGG